MPLGNPEEYMMQGMPPEQAMMMAGGGMPPVDPMMSGMAPPPMGMDPMMGDPMMGAQPDPLEMLMAAVLGKWDTQEAQLAGEQDLLMQTLMSLAGPPPPGPQDMFAEGAPMNAGMMPEDDLGMMY